VGRAGRRKSAGRLGREAQGRRRPGDGTRIDRKVLPAEGAGELKVAFTVPDNPKLTAVSFAAFVGKDYPSSLQHVTTNAVPVR